MAISLDTTAVSTDQTASPITWTHTISGLDNLLAVGVGLAAITSQPTATAVTYAGRSMTKVRGDQNGVITQLIETSIWFLANPTSGTNTISVTFSGGVTPHGAGVSVSYIGAQHESSADASSGTTGTTTGDKTFIVTTILDNCWIYAVGINVAVTAPTITADQTSRGTVSLATTTASIMRGEDTNAAQTPAGAKTVGFTIGAGAGEMGWAMSGASFAPFIKKKITGVSNIRPLPFGPGIAR